MLVRRIEDQKVSEEVKKLDPLKEPQYATDKDVLGVAIPKRSDMPFAKYGAKMVEDESGLKFNIAITKTMVQFETVS